MADDSGSIDLGATLYKAYGLEGLRGPLFNRMIEEIRARELEEEAARKNPRNNRTGIYEMCDDAHLLAHPIADFVYDPTAVILVVVTNPNQRSMLLDAWRRAIYVKHNHNHGYAFRSDCVKHDAGGKIQIVSARSTGVGRGLRCKAVYLHYTAFNLPEWDRVYHSTYPCIAQYTRA